jgi:hypothetical protein
MLNAAHIVQLHDQATLHGHVSSAATPLADTPFARLVLDQHQANFDLWHREDAARDPNASDHTITEVKHDIDRLNQLRNDLAEQIDLALFDIVPSHPHAALHSESPGLMIDRLSILALKLFHTAEQLQRSTPEHRLRNQERFAVLNEQRDDLASCLNALWSDVLSGRRRFKLYRQLKMYNDPSLNPVLYGQTFP